MPDPTYTAPTHAPVGDTVTWLLAADEYTAADGWTVALTVQGATVQGTATAQGSDWLLEFAAQRTSSLGPGAKRWFARASRSGEVRTIATGVLTLTPHGDAEFPATTHAARMLAAIEAVLENRIPADVETYSVAGRSLSKIPVRELYALRNRYRAEVAAEVGGTGAAIRQMAWQLAG